MSQYPDRENGAWQSCEVVAVGLAGIGYMPLVRFRPESFGLGQVILINLRNQGHFQMAFPWHNVRKESV